MRYHFDHWPEVPDNVVTRTVAIIGAAAAIVAVACLMAVLIVFAGAAFLGLCAALLGFDL